MIKQTVTYTDFDGAEATEDLYFHISKTDLVDNLEVKTELEEVNELIAGTGEEEMTISDIQKMVNLIKTFMRLGYGVRNEDGKQFRKNPQIWEDFTYTAAYDHFLFSLFEQPEKSMEFLVNLLPADLREEAEAQLAANEKKEKTKANLKAKS